MSDENTRTLAAYEAGAAVCRALFPQSIPDGVQAWLTAALKDRPLRSSVFEIGSGDGRDARWLSAQGYRVTSSDASTAFVSMLRDHNLNAVLFNVLTDPLPQGFDLYYANAVFLHITRTELATVLAKCYATMKPGARLAFSLKTGKGEEWTTSKGLRRFFCYWEPHPILDLLATNGLRVIHHVLNRSPDSNHDWLLIVAER